MRSTTRVVAVVWLASMASGTTSALQATRPASLLLDRAYVRDVRARGEKGDAAIKAAIAALDEDAKKALAITPMSVMDKSDHASQRRQARLHEPGAVPVAGSVEAGWQPYIRKDGQRNPEIDKITDPRQSRTARRRGHDAVAGVCLHGTRGVCGARRAARAHVVPRSRDADEPAPAVRPVHPGHQPGPRHRHHRDAGSPGAAGRRPADRRARRRGRRPTRTGSRPGCGRISRGSSRVRTAGRSRRTATTTRRGTTCRSRDWRSTRDKSTWRAGRSKAVAPASRPNRARRPPATRARAHAVLALQRVQPRRVHGARDARGARRRRPVALPDGGRPQHPAGRGLPGPLRRRRADVDVRPESPRSAPAQSRRSCAAARSPGRSPNTRRWQTRSAAIRG